MSRFAGVLFVGLVLMACGPRVAPAAQNPSAASPTRTQLPASTPTPTSTQAQDGITGVGYLLGWPRAAMTVIAGAFLYEVSDPVRPRLVCRSANTVLHLIDNKAVAYTAVCWQPRCNHSTRPDQWGRVPSRAAASRTAPVLLRRGRLDVGRVVGGLFDLCAAG